MPNFTFGNKDRTASAMMWLSECRIVCSFSAFLSMAAWSLGFIAFMVGCPPHYLSQKIKEPGLLPGSVCASSVVLVWLSLSQPEVHPNPLARRRCRVSVSSPGVVQPIGIFHCNFVLSLSGKQNRITLFEILSTGWC